MNLHNLRSITHHSTLAIPPTTQVGLEIRNNNADNIKTYYISVYYYVEQVKCPGQKFLKNLQAPSSYSITEVQIIHPFLFHIFFLKLLCAYLEIALEVSKSLSFIKIYISLNSLNNRLRIWKCGHDLELFYIKWASKDDFCY